MKDRDLRWKLDKLGLLDLDVNDKIIDGDRVKCFGVDTGDYLLLRRKVDLILEHLGLDVKSGLRLEKKAKKKFRVLDNGETVKIDLGEEYLEFACCNCELVHKMYFTEEEKKLFISFFVNEKETIKNRDTIEVVKY